MSVSFSASEILAQNGMSESDFTNETVEYMMDDSINTVNLLFTQTIDALAGEAGAKTATMTRNQSAVVKMLLSLVLRENKKTQLSSSSSTSNSTGTNSSVSAGGISASDSNTVSGSISATAAINNPSNSVYVNMFMEAGKKLVTKTTGLSFHVATGT